MSEPLLPRIASGDRSATRLCIDRYGGLVWSIARRNSPSREEAEDAVQDIFLELWRVAGRFDSLLGSETTFVTTLTRRRLIDRHRRRSVRADDRPASIDSVEPIIGEAESIFARTDASDDVSKALAALDTLAVDQRKVISLAVLHGWSHSRIAQMLQIPLGTVKTQIRRGLLKVRETLEATPAHKGVTS